MITIHGAVGAGAPNRPADVRIVQSALNQVAPNQGGPTAPLVVDGRCGHKLLAAIARFQPAHFGWTDWRVDPGQVTARSLTVVRATGAQPLVRPHRQMNAADVERWAAHLPPPHLPQRRPSADDGRPHLRGSIIGTIAAIHGSVWVNGRPATPNMVLRPGDRVGTLDDQGIVTIRFADGGAVHLEPATLVIALGQRPNMTLRSGEVAPTRLETGALRQSLARLAGRR